MRTHASRIGQVADGTLIECASITLQVYELDRISRFGTGCDGMGAVMASLAVDTSMPLRHPVEGVILFITGFRVSVITTRLLQPGFRILADLFHISMAVRTAHQIFGGHHITQALGLGARMAIVATFCRFWNLVSMFVVYS